MKIEIVISDLEEDTDQVDERYVVPAAYVSERSKEQAHPHVSRFVVAQAIMSLIAMRNRPPVSVPTVRRDDRIKTRSHTVVHHSHILLFRGAL